jgi:hydroxylamine reductase (hybrid-cluster protein)
MEYIIGAVFIALVAFFFLNKRKIEVIEEVKAVEKTVVEEVKAVEAAVVEEVKEVVKKVRKPRATPATSTAKKPAAKKAVAKKPATSKKA